MDLHFDGFGAAFYPDQHPRHTWRPYIERMAEAPAQRFGLEGGKIEVGGKANLCVFDLENEYIINSKEFLSMGKATPFEGKKVFGRSKMTLIGGKIVWQEK